MAIQDGVRQVMNWRALKVVPNGHLSHLSCVPDDDLVVSWVVVKSKGNGTPKISGISR